MSDEQFKPKEYLKMMTLEDARIKFKLRTEMLNVKFDYKHMSQNERSLWQCDSCEKAIESQSHIMWCPAYSELRAGKDIGPAVLSYDMTSGLCSLLSSCSCCYLSKSKN